MLTGAKFNFGVDYMRNIPRHSCITIIVMHPTNSTHCTLPSVSNFALLITDSYFSNVYFKY